VIREATADVSTSNSDDEETTENDNDHALDIEDLFGIEEETIIVPPWLLLDLEVYVQGTTKSQEKFSYALACPFAIFETINKSRS